jgi:argininosuccinate synthase
LVSGTVKLKLYKGSITGAGATSPNSLYDASLASFTTGPLFSHKDAEGFINLMGLPTKVRARLAARSAASAAATASLKSGGREAPAGD